MCHRVFGNGLDPFVCSKCHRPKSLFVKNDVQIELFVQFVHFGQKYDPREPARTSYGHCAIFCAEVVKITQ